MKGDPRLAMLDPSGISAQCQVPIGLAAFADCTGARIYRGPATIPAGATAVLLVLDRPLARCLEMLLSLQSSGKIVVVTFAESGNMPIADLIDKPDGLRCFFEICRCADAAVATTADSEEILRCSGARNVDFIPVPCPVGCPGWDFSVSPDRRRGIFVGTADFFPHYSNHAAALLSLRDLAGQLSEPVTVVRSDRRFDRRMLRQLRRRWPRGLLNVVPGPVPPDRLVQLMATHKVAYQLEWAGGAGQIAALALLCKIPSVGGHGTTERIAFPWLCGVGRTTDELTGLVTGLIRNPKAAEAVTAAAGELAAAHLSPEEARSRLVALVDRAAAGHGMRRADTR